MKNSIVSHIDKKDVSWISEKPDGSYIVSCPYAEVIIPQAYIDHGIAEFVENRIEVFGLFEVNIWSTPDIDEESPRKLFFRFKSKISTEPSSITSKRDANGEKELILCYNEGATFITTTNLQVDSGVARKMLDIMTLGYLPNTISYEDIAQYWTDTNVFNGINLSTMSQISIELIVAELCRDPKDYSRPFRKRIRDDPNFSYKRWKMLNTRQLPKYTSAFASLISGDPKGNICAIISRQRQGKSQKESPIEDAIL